LPRRVRFWDVQIYLETYRTKKWIAGNPCWLDGDIKIDVLRAIRNGNS
jgi:hypothetical protein